MIPNTLVINLLNIFLALLQAAVQVERGGRLETGKLKLSHPNNLMGMDLGHGEKVKFMLIFPSKDISQAPVLLLTTNELNFLAVVHNGVRTINYLGSKGIGRLWQMYNMLVNPKPPKHLTDLLQNK